LGKIVKKQIYDIDEDDNDDPHEKEQEEEEEEEEEELDEDDKRYMLTVELSQEEIDFLCEEYMKEIEDRFKNYVPVGNSFDKINIDKTREPLLFVSSHTGNKMYELYKKKTRDIGQVKD